MIHLVTGYYGYEHITSADDGALNAALIGGGQYVVTTGNQFAASIIDNNTVKVLDGNGLMFGRHFRIEPNSYETATITTGTAGVNRIDLICITYKKNESDGTEQTYLEVIKGTPSSSSTPTVPAYTTGNILEGAVFNQMPLYKVTINGVVLSQIEPMFEVVHSTSDFMAKVGGTFTGNVTHNASTHFNASTYMKNGVYYNAYDADGTTPCTILGVSGNGTLQLGTNSNAHSGNTTILSKNGYSIITSGKFNAYITVNDTAYGADAHQVLKWGRLSASSTEESSHLRCAVTDASYLGTPTYKWAALYAKNGAIQTSDRNLKKNIKDMDDKYIQLFDLVRPVSYQMVDGDRLHTGFIAQEVEDAMLEVGLTAEDLGFFCKDVKTTILDEDVGEVPVLDADGNPEYTYSLRYEEYIAIMAEKVRRLEVKYNEKIEQLEARLASLGV